MKKAKKIEIKMANVGKEWTENKRRGSELKMQKQKNPVTGSKQQQQGQAEVTPLLYCWDYVQIHVKKHPEPRNRRPLPSTLYKAPTCEKDVHREVSLQLA